MANFYSVISCIDETDIVCFSSETEYNVGDVVSLDDTDGNPFLECYQVTEIIEEESCTEVFSDNNSYGSCLDCISQITSESDVYLTYSECNTGESFTIINTAWTENNTFVPQLNFTYRIDNPNGCYTFGGLTIQEGDNTFTSVSVFYDTEYIGCEVCGLYIPYTAGSESLICQQICTTGGTTVVSVTPPHPVWTDGYGTNVTQNNMITLGGPDGLNA
jgi:hypothetical protein